MLRLTMTVVLSGFLLAVAPQVQAAPIVFTASLNPANEVPPVIGSSGTGFGIVTFDAVAHTMRVQVSFQDLTGPTTVAHIHAPIDPITQLAPVATQVPTFIGFPSGVTSGSYDEIFDTSDLATYNPSFVTANGGTAAGAEAALLDFLLAGLAYLNVHSSFAPAGEIRGNLAQVPEPAALGLLLTALGLTLAARRRRR